MNNVLALNNHQGVIIYQNGTYKYSLNTDTIKINPRLFPRPSKILYHLWIQGTTIPYIGKEDRKAWLCSVKYWEEGWIGKFSTRPVPICNGGFDRTKCVSDATIPRGSTQLLTSINIVCKSNTYQAHRLNTHVPRRICDNSEESCKLTLCIVIFLLTSLYEIVWNHQGSDGVLT